MELALVPPVRESFILQLLLLLRLLLFFDRFFSLFSIDSRRVLSGKDSYCFVVYYSLLEPCMLLKISVSFLSTEEVFMIGYLGAISLSSSSPKCLLLFIS